MQWISVKEELPIALGTVLFHTIEATTYTGIYLDGQWHFASAVWDANEVTHWMELPPAPEEVDHGNA